MAASKRRIAALPLKLNRSRWGRNGAALPAVCALVAVALGLLVSLVPLPVAVWVVLLGGVAVFAVLAPFALLCAVPFVVAFGSLFSLSVHGVNLGPTDVLVAGLTLAWLVRLLISPAARRAAFSWLAPRGLGERLATLRRAHPLGFFAVAALAAYLAVVVLSVVVAVDRAAVAKEVAKWGEVLVLTLLTFAHLRTPGRVRVLVWCVVLAGVAEAVLGCGQWALAVGSLGPGGASVRVFGTFGQPNPFGGYLNFALPVALALLLFGRDVRERWVAGAASVLLLLAQALANSRGAAIGLAAAVIVLLVVVWRRERLAAVAIAVAAPLLAVAWVAQVIPVSIQNKLLEQVRLDNVLSGQVNDSNFSTVERLAHWIAGLRMFAAHPILGVGAGNYPAAYAAYALADWPEALGHAHNYYINVAAETGVLGLLAFLALMAGTLALGWRAAHGGASGAASAARRVPIWRWPVLAPTAVLALGLLASLVALVAHNLTDDLFVHAMELQLALALGCLLRLESYHPQENAPAVLS